ncbi:MaoC family dehydratase [Nonomuraea insulae]|uniref:MaoC family dehydratase n=1 Tax=Nonomuraea insulae TaxID=1616787 RepID=A0ABW1D7Z5_9ACTN
MSAEADGVEGLRLLVGRKLGYSEWLKVTADQVALFAEATGDRQWIHLDRERAAAGRFGSTIVHGFLILSLTPMLLEQILEMRGFSVSVNYGCDRVRFLAPVLVGTQVRAGATLNAVRELRGGAELSLTVVFQARGSRVPVCVAQVVLRNYV